MSEKQPVVSQSQPRAGALADILKRLRLTWLLFRDSRISLWIKAVIPLSLLYVINPVDFIPDIWPVIGQMDDLGVILLGMTLFVRLCPPHVVMEYREQLYDGVEMADDDAVDGSYRVLKD